MQAVDGVPHRRVTDSEHAVRVTRLAFLLAAASLFAVSVGAHGGKTLSWPVPIVWSAIAATSGVAHLAFAWSHRVLWLRASTASLIVAAQARALGQLIAGHPSLSWQQVVLTIGTWELAVAYATVMHISVRTRFG